MKRFQNMTNQQKVNDAIVVAESLLSFNSNMMSEIKAKNDFAFDSGTGIQVYDKICKCEAVAPVYTYKAKWFLSKALGYSDSTGVYLNLRKLDSISYKELIGLLCHEWLHYGPHFTHGNNYPSEFKNKFSVNYFVSSNISKWI
jgi:predicted metallopeptidase